MDEGSSKGIKPDGRSTCDKNKVRECNESPCLFFSLNLI